MRYSILNNCESNIENSHGTILITGVHGVGKSTLCHAIAEEFMIVHIEASSLLAGMDSPGKLKNKDLLARESMFIAGAVRKLLNKEKRLILDGHSVLLDNEQNIVPVDIDIFEGLGIVGVIVIIDDVTRIASRLRNRGTEINCDLLAHFQDAELMNSSIVATRQKIPFNTLILQEDFEYNKNKLGKILSCLFGATLNH